MEGYHDSMTTTQHYRAICASLRVMCARLDGVAERQPTIYGQFAIDARRILEALEKDSPTPVDQCGPLHRLARDMKDARGIYGPYTGEMRTLAHELDSYVTARERARERAA